MCRNVQLTHWLSSICLVIALAAWAEGTRAQDGEEVEPAAQQQEETPDSALDYTVAPGEPSTPSLLAFIDPVTGKLVTPTPEQLLELERLRQTDPNLVLPQSGAPIPEPGLESGIMVSVPANLHPRGHATVGPGGKAAVKQALAPGGPVIYDGAEHLGPSETSAESPAPKAEPIEHVDSGKPVEPAQDHRDSKEGEEDKEDEEDEEDEEG